MAKILQKCHRLGLHSFALFNAAHFNLVSGAERVMADSPLWCLNTAAQAQLQSWGADRFVYSPEDEILNIRAAASPKGVAILFGKPNLFISRMHPGADLGKMMKDPHGNRFAVQEKNRLYYTIAENPLCLFAKRAKLQSCGIHSFLIDLSFHQPDYSFAGMLISHYRASTRVEGGSISNFKAGLK